MYAVIETGGKQYRVEVGTELRVDLLDLEAGQAITIDRVLLVGDGDATTVGQPLVADAAVEAEVVRFERGEKLIVFKYRPKARTRVKKGHRQNHLVLRITDVKLNGRSAAEETRKEQQAAQTERQRLEAAAARQAAADADLAAKLASKTPARPVRGSKASTASSKTAADEKAVAPKRTSGEKPAAKAKPAAAEKKAAPEKPAGKAKQAAARSTTDKQTEKPAPKRGRQKKDE